MNDLMLEITQDMVGMQLLEHEQEGVFCLTLPDGRSCRLSFTDAVPSTDRHFVGNAAFILNGLRLAICKLLAETPDSIEVAAWEEGQSLQAATLGPGQGE